MLWARNLRRNKFVCVPDVCPSVPYIHTWVCVCVYWILQWRAVYITNQFKFIVKWMRCCGGGGGSFNFVFGFCFSLLFFRFVLLKTKRTRVFVPFAAAHQHKCRSELMNYTHTCMPPQTRTRDNNDFVETESTKKLKKSTTRNRRERKKSTKYTFDSIQSKPPFVWLQHVHTRTRTVSVFKCAVFNCVAASLII